MVTPREVSPGSLPAFGKPGDRVLVSVAPSTEPGGALVTLLSVRLPPLLLPLFRLRELFEESSVTEPLMVPPEGVCVFDATEESVPVTSDALTVVAIPHNRSTPERNTVEVTNRECVIYMIVRAYYGFDRTP
jgi:hypothetical protein